MNTELKYRYYSKGHIVIKGVLNKKLSRAIPCAIH